MRNEGNELRSENWRLLYEKLKLVMLQHGTEDPFGEGSFWILDEDWGPNQHKICVFNLDILQSYIVSEAQKLLKEFPSWSIMFAVDIPGKETEWPPMGLIVRENEIIDGLQRQYFPPEYQSIQYEGSRVGTDKD